MYYISKRRFDRCKIEYVVYGDKILQSFKKFAIELYVRYPVTDNEYILTSLRMRYNYFYIFVIVFLALNLIRIGLDLPVPIKSILTTSNNCIYLSKGLNIYLGGYLYRYFSTQIPPDIFLSFASNSVNH